MFNIKKWFNKKRIVFVLFALAFIVLVMSSCKKEEVILIKYNPETTHGYLVFNKDSKAKIAKLHITVVESLDKDKERILYDTIVEHDNYIKLPSECFMPSEGIHILTVTGLKKNGKEVGSEDMQITYKQCVNPNQYDSDFGWTCIGYNYAWKITANRIVYNGVASGNGYLTLDDAWALQTQDGGTPYYVYMLRETWNSLTNTDGKWRSFKDFHHLRQNERVPVVDGMEIIKLEHVTAGQNLRGYHGQVVVGDTVYGVQKTKGYWQNPAILTDEINGININNSMQWAIERMNIVIHEMNAYNNHDTIPDLECFGQCYTPLQPIDYGGFSSDFYSSLVRCWGTINNYSPTTPPSWPFNIGQQSPTFINHRQWLEAMKKCKDLKFPYSENISSIAVSQVASKYDSDKPLDNGITIHTDNIANVPSVTFTPGLYVIGFTDKKNQYAYIVEEITSNFKFEPNSSYFTTIYEDYKFDGNKLTVTTDSYNETLATVFVYNKGKEVVHKQDVLISKGFASVNILFESKIEDGEYTCEFIYSDNSSSTITINKQ